MYQNKLFSVIVSEVQSEVRDTSSAFTSIVKPYVNQRYFDIINRLITLNLFEMTRKKTVTTAANQRVYEMPFDFGEIMSIVDTTNNCSLSWITEQEWVQAYGEELSTTGVPFVAILTGDGTVLTQPSSSTKLTFVSSSNSDTTQVGFIRGISGSAERYESVNLSGTTSGQSSNNYDYIMQLSKNLATVGAVTFTYSTGGGNVSVLSPEDTTSIRRTLGFHYIPSGVYTFDVRYKRQIKPMISDNDSPIIDISDIIEIGAKADAWRNKRQIATAADFENRYEMAFDRYINQRQAGLVHQFDVQPYNRSDSY